MTYLWIFFFCSPFPFFFGWMMLVSPSRACCLFYALSILVQRPMSRFFYYDALAFPVLASRCLLAVSSFCRALGLLPSNTAVQTSVVLLSELPKCLSCRVFIHWLTFFSLFFVLFGFVWSCFFKMGFLYVTVLAVLSLPLWTRLALNSETGLSPSTQCWDQRCVSPMLFF